MKNVLIVADGILAKHFLERLFNSKNNNLHNYTIITYDNETLPKSEVNFENFTFFNFDPTSAVKLEFYLKNQYDKIMIIMQSKLDTKTTYENLRKLYSAADIDLLDLWGLEANFNNDMRLFLIDVRKIVSSRFMDFLPDVPVIADNIGLGIGEIMEVKIPNGSSYAYKYISNIRKKKWNIAMIYRNNDYIMPAENTVILPNDILLIVGDPRVLEGVFRAVKKEPGQFPNPFGNNIYLPIDMKIMSDEDIINLLNDTILIHSKLNNKKLFINVINPTISPAFKKIRNLNARSIQVIIDYKTTQINVTKAGLGELDIGLLITNLSIFKKKKTLFYEAKIPVLKIGSGGFLNIKNGVIVANEEDAQMHSNVILDCCTQLKLDIDFYKFNNEENEGLVEFFENLSKLFNKKVNIIKSTQNPLLKLRKRRDIVQFISFSQKILKGGIGSIFSQDTDRLHYILDKNYQLFIPKNDRI